MAEGPQVENGFTKIDDDFLEGLIRYRIPGEQMQCLLFIIRKTWGWGKASDIISLSQFVKATGLKKPHVCRALTGLERKKIIVAKKGNRTGKTYRINKHYENWKLLPKKVTLPKKVMRVTKKGNSPLPLLGTTIDTINTSTIDNSPPFEEIVDYLNTKSGKAFKTNSRKTTTLIKARWSEGFRIDDFKGVIDNKIRSWLNDLKMNAFIRPETLFGTKFESYLNESSSHHKAPDIDLSQAAYEDEVKALEDQRATPEQAIAILGSYRRKKLKMATSGGTQ